MYTRMNGWKNSELNILCDNNNIFNEQETRFLLESNIYVQT